MVAFLVLLAPWTVAAEMRVVAIGDSLTHGFGLPPEEGFVPTLERWLHANGVPDAVVVNMGVSGDTTEGGRARLGWALGGGADAVIIELGGNDMLRGIDPARSKANLMAMAAELEQSGIPTLIAGLKAPLNFGPEYKAAFDGMFAAAAEAHGALVYPDFLAGILDERGGGRAVMQSDGIHPSAEGVRLIVEAIGPDVLRLIAMARE